MTNILAVGHLLDTYYDFKYTKPYYPLTPEVQTPNNVWPYFWEVEDNGEFTYALTIPSRHYKSTCSLKLKEEADTYYFQTRTTVHPEGQIDSVNFYDNQPYYPQLLYSFKNSNNTTLFYIELTTPNKVTLYTSSGASIELVDYPIADSYGDNIKTIDFRVEYGLCKYYVDGVFKLDLPNIYGHLDHISFGDVTKQNNSYAWYLHVLVGRQPLFGYKVETLSPIAYSEFFDDFWHPEEMKLGINIAGPTLEQVIRAVGEKQSFEFMPHIENYRDLEFIQANLLTRNYDKHNITFIKTLRNNILEETPINKYWKNTTNNTGAFQEELSLPDNKRWDATYEYGINLEYNG